MPVLPFCKPAYHRVPRQSKIDRQVRPCHFLKFGYNHGSDWFKVMDAETGRIVHSSDVTWHQPREPLTPLAPTVGLGVPRSPSGAETPDYVHIQPAPAATATPTAAAGACVSYRHTRAAPRAATKPLRLNSQSHCSRTGAQGRRAYAWLHARRNARDEGVYLQHESAVSCRIGARDGHPRGVRRGLPRA